MTDTEAYDAYCDNMHGRPCEECGGYKGQCRCHEEPMEMPPWFVRAMTECESLSLDVPSDRQRLWERIRRNMPEAAIEAAIGDNADPHGTFDGGNIERQAARITAAVLAALDEA